MNKYLNGIKVIVLALLLSSGVSFVLAQWTGPTASFPDGNTERPINVGADLQAKTGSLWADFLGSDTGLYAQGNAEIGGTLTVAGGSPAQGKVLVADDNSGLSYWSSLGVNFSCRPVFNTTSGSSASVSCSQGEVVSGGGGSCGLGNIRSSIPTSAAQDGWQLSCSTSGTITVYAVCCGSDLLMTAEPNPANPI